jgi:HK97 family phage major capsid protein
MRDRYSQFQNAAGVGTGAAGGYLVPPEFRDTMVETMKWYGPMLNVAEVITTDTGANLPWPTNDDTANVGAILAENTQITEQDVTLGTASIDAYMYTSKLVRVSYQLLQDRPDFDTWLARKLGERIGRIWNQHFTTGTGTAQPDGIVTSATVGVTGTGSFATTGGVSYDNIIDLEEALDPAYGGGQGLQFMVHQTARKALRKLKDTQGRYLWEPSLQAGRPASLDGYEVILNNDMPTLATSSKSILFGNIREAYVIRKVRDIQTARLNERYADFLQVGFFGFARADGTMQNANAVRVFQTTATA